MTIDTVSSRSIPLAWIAGVGASAGLGAALGRRFARGGYAVVLTGRTHERVAAVADEIRAQGGVAHVASGDIASEADVERLAIEVRTLGALRAAVFNAGNAVRAPTLELSVAQFEHAWRTNVIGGFLFAKAALAQLLDADGGAPGDEAERRAVPRVFGGEREAEPAGGAGDEDLERGRGVHAGAMGITASCPALA